MTWKQCNKQLQVQNISISIWIYTDTESALMKFISAVMKGADTNPCIHLSAS